jgi:hypothetical protein
MTLQIQTAGLKISGGNEVLSEAEMAKLNSFWPAHNGKYDFGALTRFLIMTKKHYPKSRNMVIIPDDDIAYETIITAMDASRETLAKSATEAKPLFPDVVVSRTVK